jgi:hypothetical protein
MEQIISELSNLATDDRKLKILREAIKLKKKRVDWDEKSPEKELLPLTDRRGLSFLNGEKLRHSRFSHSNTMSRREIKNAKSLLPKYRVVPYAAKDL